ncbi:glycerophosphodiester phosphodiesterase [Vallitalea sediminicola]
MSRLPLITAHAGCMNTVPNTIESIMKGIEEGADIIEVDVRATQDGIPVLIHDSSVNTISGKVMQIGEVTFKELKEHTGNKLITLTEALDIAHQNNTVLNLDIKSLDAIDSIAALVTYKKMNDYIILSGCKKEKAMYLYKNYPQFQYLLNVDTNLLDRKDIDSQSIIKEICHEANTISCCGINIDYKYCNKELVEYAHSRFLPVAVWTIDDECDMEKYIELGVYSITTNNVNALKTIKRIH